MYLACHSCVFECGYSVELLVDPGPRDCSEIAGVKGGAVFHPTCGHHTCCDGLFFRLLFLPCLDAGCLGALIITSTYTHTPTFFVLRSTHRQLTVLGFVSGA